MSSIQSFSPVWLFVNPWTAGCQASLSINNSWNLLKLMCIGSVIPSNHLILGRPLLLPPSIFPSIKISQQLVWVGEKMEKKKEKVCYDLSTRTHKWSLRVMNVGRSFHRRLLEKVPGATAVSRIQRYMRTCNLREESYNTLKSGVRQAKTHERG